LQQLSQQSSSRRLEQAALKKESIKRRRQSVDVATSSIFLSIDKQCFL
jgi:hypothetical protein